jgi:hypothetical protein
MSEVISRHVEFSSLDFLKKKKQLLPLPSYFFLRSLSKRHMLGVYF